MKAWVGALVLIGALGEQAASPVPPAVARPPVRVRLETSLGAIEVEVDAARAPVTAANFLRYVERGDYDGGRFHRTVRDGNQPGKTVLIDVVQAGRDPASSRPELPAIPLERTRVTGLRHVDGAVSMARDGPDTATSDFFICIGTSPSWTSADAATRTARASPPSGGWSRAWTWCAGSRPLPPTGRRSPRR